MKTIILTTVSLLTMILTSCGTNSEEKSLREKAIMDSVKQATIKELADKNSLNKKSIISESEKPIQKTPAQNEDMSNYNWAGVYEGGDDNVGYSLTVKNDGPMRWTEFGFELEASGIQTYFKIKGYAIRTDDGKLDLHYMETADGAFYQADQMDINETMFKLQKKDKIFKPINGKWKINDFVTTLEKK
jgi:hypothetical protein